MSKEYEEWLSGKILTYCEEFECAQAFEAGQQSQQAKIDELQNQVLLLKGWEKIAQSNGEKMREYCSDVILLQERINNVLQIISQSELHGDRSIWGLQEEIKEILRGIE